MSSIIGDDYNDNVKMRKEIKSAEMKLLFFRKEGNLMKDKLQNVLLSISAKVESNKYLGSIKEAFTMFVPFIIVGSFGSMLNILVAGANGLAKSVHGYQSYHLHLLQSIL